MNLEYFRNSKCPLHGGRLHKRQQSRREAMDRITLGDCLRLYCVLGWTADIRAGHLTALKKEEGGV